MSSIPNHFKVKTQGKAAPEAVVLAGKVRFSLLTSRMVRMEYDPNEIFEDRASQIFWFRQQPKPAFEVKKDKNCVEIITDHLHLCFNLKYIGEPFSSENLSIEVCELGTVWRYGMEDRGNLLGTLRTLDMIDGFAPLEPGLISRDGWALVDDSKGLVFNDDGWLEARNNLDTCVDLIFFGYGLDFNACIQDYCRVSGQPGMVPRWALGNWWSRYWAYSQDELQELINEFKFHGVPLSVCIIDMDWHITETGNESSGWTGYTWNRELFPDPVGTLEFIHKMGLKSGLNLHPAGGIYPHEELYLQMAEAVGVDPASKEPVSFDLENPQFAKPYFNYLHHPQEEQVGIDFWWMDWQQGNPSRLPHLNLLWWINHLHYIDLGRNKVKRSFLFSRWGGLGNHRYPIGFSGDTIISWASLAFQPYLTATAANVGFGWWSHDIGGHMGGITDAELFTRWVQFGVFSPIMRLHSTKDPFLERRPWGYDRETYRIVRDYMQLRHALIPYLYTMAWRDHQYGIPLSRPMYYSWPSLDQAYTCPNQYEFGSELVVAPFVKPIESDTRFSRQAVWLPEGLWFNYFSGRSYLVNSPEGEWFSEYGTIEETPVFAKAGAIIPMGPAVDWGGVENPYFLSLRLFPGASNSFHLYEDDGESQFYRDGNYSITHIYQRWEEFSGENRIICGIDPIKGDAHIPGPSRKYEFVFYAISAPRNITASINDLAVDIKWDYDENSCRLTVSKLTISPKDSLIFTLDGVNVELNFNLEARYQELISTFHLENQIKNALVDVKPSVIEGPEGLNAFQVALTRSQIRALIETLYGVGYDYNMNTGIPLVVVWNNQQRKQFTYLISSERLVRRNFGDRYWGETNILPQFRYIRPDREFEFPIRNRSVRLPGLIQIDYSHLLRVNLEFNTQKINWLAKEGLF
jgi:hypothetical protein